ncbi:indolepyruvate ferredoxin oxidoreductase family protein [Enhydrobacter sp.]|uniref:indolepyruvate ferredoxin oxidoreductase family protein n=1 Tax=Enhydrobacter sp. TaxID=1894999 RepID=UPI002609878A|nr:indolepyruvate ferredoxin oxidoreductase family protein [Enhydrobacter sp.]WIM13537.1 MAG: indolepyruvate ferredoxin oxidoreductase family protein [Enhydrobacter sp.]
MSPAVTLDDKYALERGRVYLTGTQALVRLPMMQRQRDAAAGLNTAGYISGYRGSPLGGFDQTLWQAKRFIKKNHIEFQPALNEDLAATALWGTQQIHLYPGARYDGVFGIWYGKGPGVDRSGDALKHANYAGTSRHGGVVALAGDDHMAKSSTLAHQSEPAFIAAGIPVIHAASVQEYLDLGLHAFAMSRYSGLWIGFKVVSETVDSSASVHVDPHRIEIRTPADFPLPPDGLHIRWPDDWLGQEKRLITLKQPAALAYWRANRLDRLMLGRPDARFGIVTVGKSYLDVRQALDELGIDQTEAERLGIAIYKVGLVWPLETQGALAFSEGKREILVVEEKRPLIEPQLKDALFNTPADRRPAVVGKRDERGQPLLKSDGELTPFEIASALVARLGLDAFADRTRQRFERLTRLAGRELRNEAGMARVPYFCSGCPHNSSTRVPDGSMAMAGIGCHTLAIGMERNTRTFTHMGAEGASWVGASHFTDMPHVFQNLGDGTYFHSGYLAIRQAVAAGTNITYKILYNDAVAMTGGQPHDGDVHPWTISQQVHAEGVRRIALVSDEPRKYPPGTQWAPGVTFHHRDQLDEVQRELREWKGVSVLIYDQTCAAEKRRRRKRGTYPDPARRVFINEAVCEGCGDCSVQSNCLSVTPVETEFGTKRAIDQSSCNKDFSCVNGFCPSFVTVEGGRLRHGKAQIEKSASVAAEPPIPAAPRLPSVGDEPYGVLITGIGGTGVVTIGALIGMAAHIEGKGATVLDQLGMAQKGGAVVSHVRIGASPEALHAVRLGAGGADLLLGCDLVVSASPDALARLEPGVSRLVVNMHETITGEFTRRPDLAFPSHTLRLSIEAAAGAGACDFLEATRLATGLMGDSIATNLFMLGYAYQKGLIPIGHEALEQAIELNGTAVPMNLAAFRWGRRAAADPAAVEKLVAPPATDHVVAFGRPVATLDEIVASRTRLLTAFQNTALAERYRSLVARVRTAEQEITPDDSRLAEAVARNYAKLLAYKDEYEVARLHADMAFAARIDRQFEGDYRLKFHLAPPLFARRDPRTGHLVKREYGPWMLPVFRLLAKLKFLRGTAFDPFGRTDERKQERALIGEYERLVGALLADLTPANHGLAVELASVPDDIRGYGHVKQAHLEKAKRKQAELLARWHEPAPLRQAAE